MKMHYFLIYVQRLVSFNLTINDYSRVNYLPMCGWQDDSGGGGGSQFKSTNPSPHHHQPRGDPRPSQPQPLTQQSPSLLPLENSNSSDDGDSDGRNSTKKPFDHIDLDHIDRLNTKQRLVILTYTSTYTSSPTKRTGDDKDENDENDQHDGNKSGIGAPTNTRRARKKGGQEMDNTNTAGLYHHATDDAKDGDNDDNDDDEDGDDDDGNPIDNKEPSSNWTTGGDTLIGARRRKRKSVTISTKSHKVDEVGDVSCWCLVEAYRNFTLHILDVQGSRPENSRLVLERVGAADNDKHDLSFDVKSLWERQKHVKEWKQEAMTAKMKVKVIDLVKPTSPYTLVMAITGPRDMDVNCQESSSGPSIARPIPMVKVKEVTTTTTHTPGIKQEVPGLGRSSSEPDSAFLSPFFIGAITLCSVAFIFMVVALALFKRSRSFSSYITSVSKISGGMGGNRTHGQHEEAFLGSHYEEIPGGSGRSGSKTRLGTLSLVGLRKQSSSSLSSGVAGTRKNSKTMSGNGPMSPHAVLTVQPEQPSTTTTAMGAGTNSSSRTPATAAIADTTPPDYSIYEELPGEAGCCSGGGETSHPDTPPAKPFLDRKSLMISRSQSSPAHQNCRVGVSGAGVDCGGEPGQHRPPLLTSKSCTVVGRRVDSDDDDDDNDNGISNNNNDNNDDHYQPDPLQSVHHPLEKHHQPTVTIADSDDPHQRYTEVTFRNGDDDYEDDDDDNDNDRTFDDVNYEDDDDVKDSNDNNVDNWRTKMKTDPTNTHHSIGQQQQHHNGPASVGQPETVGRQCCAPSAVVTNYSQDDDDDDEMVMFDSVLYESSSQVVAQMATVNPKPTTYY